MNSTWGETENSDKKLLKSRLTFLNGLAKTQLQLLRSSKRPKIFSFVTVREVRAAGEHRTRKERKLFFS